LLFKFWTLWALEPRFGGSGARYDVQRRLIGKRVVDFLLVLIELSARFYGWGATSENRLTIGVLQRGGWASAKFSRTRGYPPPVISTWIDRPMHALQLSLTVLTQRNFVADFLQAKCDFTQKTAVFRFWASLAGLGATYDVYLRLVGKFVADFLLVIVELFR